LAAAANAPNGVEWSPPSNPDELARRERARADRLDDRVDLVPDRVDARQCALELARAVVDSAHVDDRLREVAGLGVQRDDARVFGQQHDAGLVRLAGQDVEQVDLLAGAEDRVGASRRALAVRRRRVERHGDDVDGRVVFAVREAEDAGSLPARQRMDRTVRTSRSPKAERREAARLASSSASGLLYRTRVAPARGHGELGTRR
jgi:hypothetical protein